MNTEGREKMKETTLQNPNKLQNIYKMYKAGDPPRPITASSHSKHVSRFETAMLFENYVSTDCIKH